MNGTLLVNKAEGISSFGVIEELQKLLRERLGIQKRRDLPKLGHGGTLDPFATGLLAVCSGRAVKLARYFLGSRKSYEGIIRFGETTIPGDPTAPISETSDVIPESIEVLSKLAKQLTLQPYLQTPPMHSAKKKDGKPLYELAREGIEVEREAKLCHLYEFEILSYEKPRARIRVSCSSGTYIRTLAQDFARILGSVALLESLERTASGGFSLSNAWTLDQIREGTAGGTRFEDLPCWIPFDRVPIGFSEGFERADATEEETHALFQGRQNVLFNILRRAPVSRFEERSSGGHVAIYHQDKLIAVARRDEGVWGLDRVFTPGSG